MERTKNTQEHWMSGSINPWQRETLLLILANAVR